MITTSNTVFGGISPSKLSHDLILLSEWFATKPSDFGGEYTDGWRMHNKLFKDEAFQYLFNTHCPARTLERVAWIQYDWNQKAILALLEAEYLSTLLD